LKGVTVVAKDGEFGKADQLFFDDQNWAVRYLIIEIGKLFTGKKVLFSPKGVRRIDADGIHVDATAMQISGSPDIDADKPVSRLMEEQLHDFYGWPYYWDYPVGYGSMGTPVYPGYGAFYAPQAAAAERTGKEMMDARKRALESHLRSSREVIGYDLSAGDEIIGKTHDMLVDTDRWVIRYLIVDAGGVCHGRKLILAASWIHAISWEDRMLSTDIAGDVIKSGPTLQPETTITREFETRLFDYYEKPHYWESGAASEHTVGHHSREPNTKGETL
jgi:hypothetical protein